MCAEPMKWNTNWVDIKIKKIYKFSYNEVYNTKSKKIKTKYKIDNIEIEGENQVTFYIEHFNGLKKQCTQRYVFIDGKLMSLLSGITDVIYNCDFNNLLNKEILDKIYEYFQKKDFENLIQILIDYDNELEK